MTLTVDIMRLPNGRYSLMGDNGHGPICGDGMTVEGIVRTITLAVIDGLEESVDLRDLDKWECD